MPSSLDRQISSIDQDAFGHRHFAQALQSLIESESHTPPFSVGLLGGWGTGKSTIKELYIHGLENDAHKNNHGLTRSKRFHSITFNAWRFGGRDQDVKRALLRHVFLELGGDEKKLQDRLFRQIRETHQIPKGWLKNTWDILKAWAMPVPAFLISLSLLLTLLVSFMKFVPVEDDFSRSIIVLALAGAFTYLHKQVKAPVVAANYPVTRIDFPITTAEQYEDLLLDQLEKFKSGESKTLDGKKCKDCERLVVFVDDLDRLSAEEMVLGLDAVRTFMEIPAQRLPEGLGLVFIISCDETKVAQALAERRRQGDMPGTVFSQTDARRYLDRIFQFRLEIPPFPRNDMRQYAIKKLKELPGIEADLNKRGIPIETLVDRMIHVGVRNPRNALQIVNAFSQAWWLAKKRETEELGTERPGGLHEGSVTMHPISLGALSAIKVNFPDFYQDLQKDPALLHRMTDVMVRGKFIKDQPLAAQQLFTERYFKEIEGSSQTSFELRTEHRPLRQFLASLTGLRWPVSLQSLLFLSEDPITRKYGQKATSIYAALVSGDTQGVLEGLGRHVDATPLKQDEARLLHLMVEDLRQESVTRRTGASRVIADLVDRLPKDTARLLLGSLCRELGDSADLRSQLGIQKIANVLAVAHGDDQRAVASRLIEDVLTIDEDVHLRLETMEPPNLEEAVAFVQATISLVLPIRRAHGLDPAADTQFINWLIDRTVKIGGKSHQFSFEEFEQWMTDHEDHLLPALSYRYTDILATELESETIPDIDTSAAIERARKVFISLWNAGEDTRPILWKNISRYVALNLPEASQAAWEVMAEHVTSPNADYFGEFLNNFIDRLTNEANDEEWSLELELAAQTLLSLIRARLTDIDSNTLNKASELAILWSGDDHNAALSCDVTKELQRAGTTASQLVFDNWSQRILQNLPIDCIEMFASIFPTLKSPVHSNAMTQINQVISTDKIDEATGKRYEAFVKNVPDEAWDTAPLKGHLDSILPQIAARHNNPNKYLHRIFPTIVKVLHHASPGPLGQSLNNLFTQAKGQPSHYAWLHSCMATRWPEPSANLSPYNPVQIFSEGHNFAITQPQSSSKGLLSSLRDMLNRELVPANQHAAVIEAACATWAAKPDQAIDTFTNGFGDLAPAQAANLIDCVDWTNDERQNLLSRAWSSVVQSQNIENQIQATVHILGKGIQGPDNEPDRGVRLWFDALAENSRAILETTILRGELSDTHRKRLWLQATRLAESLGSGFFLEVIPKIAILSSIEETASSLFSEYELVYNILGSTDNHAELSHRLMESFTDASTNTIKASIASWCKKLSGNASLKALKNEALTPDDIDILKPIFGNSALIKKLEKNVNGK